MGKLTKENFWNKMEQRYPKAVQFFQKWIDQYKLDNNWSELFNANKEEPGDPEDRGEPTYTVAPKYHELPIAIQMGIWFQFVGEVSGEAPKAKFPKKVMDLIEEGLGITEEEL